MNSRSGDVGGHEQDFLWMDYALDLAREAQEAGEVPVGAVVVGDGKLVGCGMNQQVTRRDASAHAEVVALRNAGAALENHRLPGTTLYVTIEPCVMCLGAAVHARIERLVFGAREPRAGAVCTHPVAAQRWMNHAFEVAEGVRAEECGQLMSSFFEARRRR